MDALLEEEAQQRVEGVVRLGEMDARGAVAEVLEPRVPFGLGEQGATDGVVLPRLLGLHLGEPLPGLPLAPGEEVARHPEGAVADETLAARHRRDGGCRWSRPPSRCGGCGPRRAATARRPWRRCRRSSGAPAPAHHIRGPDAGVRLEASRAHVGRAAARYLLRLLGGVHRWRPRNLRGSVRRERVAVAVQVGLLRDGLAARLPRAAWADGRAGHGERARPRAGRPSRSGSSSPPSTGSVVSVEPRPSACAARSRFCTAGKTEASMAGGEGEAGVAAHDDQDRRRGDAAHGARGRRRAGRRGRGAAPRGPGPRPARAARSTRRCAARSVGSRTTTKTKGWLFSALGAWVAAVRMRATVSSSTSSGRKERAARCVWTTSKKSGIGVGPDRRAGRSRKGRDPTVSSSATAAMVPSTLHDRCPVPVDWAGPR